MALNDDLKRVPGLEQAYCKGLQAIPKDNRDRIRTADPRNISGSADVDGALQVSRPNDARWDYVVGYRSSPVETLYWIEVHPAKSGENIKEVRRKHDWLKRWLAREAKPLDRKPRDFIWLATEGVAFNSRSPQLRSLAEAGLRFVGSRLAIP